MAPPISQRLQKVPSKVTAPATIPAIIATAVERPSANKNPTRFPGSLEVHSAPNVGAINLFNWPANRADA
jgi:hypothetical protein